MTSTPTPLTARMHFEQTDANEPMLCIEGLSDQLLRLPLASMYEGPLPEVMHRLFMSDIFWHNSYGFFAQDFGYEGRTYQLAFRPVKPEKNYQRHEVLLMTLLGGYDPDSKYLGSGDVWDVPVNPEQLANEYRRAFSEFYEAHQADYPENDRWALGLESFCKYDFVAKEEKARYQDKKQGEHRLDQYPDKYVAVKESAWQRAEALLKSGQMEDFAIYDTTVFDKNNVVYVGFGGLHAVIPAEQLPDELYPDSVKTDPTKARKQLRSLVGTVVPARVVAVDREAHVVRLSARPAAGDQA